MIALRWLVKWVNDQAVYVHATFAGVHHSTNQWVDEFRVTSDSILYGFFLFFWKRINEFIFEGTKKFSKQNLDSVLSFHITIYIFDP